MAALVHVYLICSPPNQAYMNDALAQSNSYDNPKEKRGFASQRF